MSIGFSAGGSESSSDHTTPPHQVYADPIDGGYGGYEAACHDYDWRSGVVHENKNEARRDTKAHCCGQGCSRCLREKKR